MLVLYLFGLAAFFGFLAYVNREGAAEARAAKAQAAKANKTNAKKG